MSTCIRSKLSSSPAMHRTLWALALVVLTGCGGKSSKSQSAGEDEPLPSAGGGAPAAAPDAVALDLNIIPATGANASGLALTDVDSGHTSRAEILSLKYYLTNISLCQDAKLSGTSYSDPTGCITIFANTTHADLYEKFGPEEAEKVGYDQHYVDLMKGFKGSVKLDRSSIGRYKYALVNWMKPIKVTASVRLNGFLGSSLFTHKGTYETSTDPSGNPRTLTRVSAKLSEGPAEEAVVSLNNGGSIFAFQSPLVITEEDISSRAAYTMDMVFNPDGLIKGYSTSSSNTAAARAATLPGSAIVGQPLSDGGGGETLDQFEIPMISLVPLVHKKSDVLVKETYKIAMNQGLQGKLNGTNQSGGNVSTPFDVRVELYYIDDQSGGFSPKTPIYAASLTSLIRYRTTGGNQTSEAYLGVFPNLQGLSQDGATGDLTLFDWRGATDGALVQSMKRLATEGSSGTLTFACSKGAPLIPGTLCYNSNTQTYNTVTFAAPYTLESRVVLSAASENAKGALDSASADQTAATTLALWNTNAGWYGSCVVTGGSTSSLRVFNFNKDLTMTMYDYFFSGTTCDFDNDLSYYRALFGSYRVGGEVAPGINKISFVKEYLFLVPTAATYQDFNTTNRCGYGGTDWAANTGYDIFGESCADAQGQGSAMDQVFGVVKRDGSNLYWFGTEAGKTGTSPDSRITVVDMATPYTSL